MADHCVRIEFPYVDTNLDALVGLEKALEQAIADAGVGEFDGNEIGEGLAILFMYGADADTLLRSILPVVQSSPLLARGTVKSDAMDLQTRESEKFETPCRCLSS